MKPISRWESFHFWGHRRWLLCYRALSHLHTIDPAREPAKCVKLDKLEKAKVILNRRLLRVLVWRKKWLYSLPLLLLLMHFWYIFNPQPGVASGTCSPWLMAEDGSLQPSHMFLQVVGVQFPSSFSSRAWGTTALPSEALFPTFLVAVCGPLNSLQSACICFKI